MHVRLPLDHFDMHSAFDIEEDKALSEPICGHAYEATSCFIYPARHTLASLERNH